MRVWTFFSKDDTQAAPEQGIPLTFDGSQPIDHSIQTGPSGISLFERCGVVPRGFASNGPASLAAYWRVKPYECNRLWQLRGTTFLRG